MKISIITVVRNDLEGLQKTFNSVKSSLCREIEWIVVDGNSTDGTIEFLQQLDSPHMKWISEKDKNMYDGMNKGINIASGEYLQFLNAGDILEKNLKEYFLYRNYTEDLVFFNITKLDSDHNPINWSLPRDFIKQLRRYPSVPHQSTFVNKRIISKYGNYNIGYRFLGDYDFFLKIFTDKRHYPTCAYDFDTNLVSFICNGATFTYKYSLKFLKEYILIQQQYYSKVYLKTAIMYFTKYIISFIPGHIKLCNKLRYFVKFQ